MLIRILHAVGPMNLGGVETALMSVYREIDREKYQFDFLVHEKVKGYFDDEIIAMGGTIYNVPTVNPKWFVSYYKKVNEILKYNNYKIMHGHLSARSVFPLTVAKIKGIPVKITHSHSSQYEGRLNAKKIFYLTLGLMINYVCDYRWAPTMQAAENLFGKYKSRTEIIVNPVNCEKFRFSQSVRDSLRLCMAINNKRILTQVGRFDLNKNHRFSVDVFSELLKLNDSWQLVFVGSGREEYNIRSIVKGRGLEEKVLFLGNRNDVHLLMQAFDAFIFPSYKEGFGIVAIEAQASGLECFVSDTLPHEMEASDKVTWLSLNKAPKYWAKKINSDYSTSERASYCDIVRSKGFDAHKVASRWTSLYDRYLKEKNT